MSLCESLDFSEAEVETAGELAAGNRDGKKENDMMSNTAGIVGESAIVPEDSTTLRTAAVTKVEKKKEKKNPPLLFNLAELQNTSSKLFKISPDETLKIVQELYEKKLVTYPRTDARVLSTAVCKEIHKNLAGLRGYPVVSEIADHILQVKGYQGLSKTRYVNDKQITDHYAIIPTGQGLGALRSVSQTAARVYEVIVRRFLCIFYPPAEYLKLSITACRKSETFFANFKVMTSPGYLAIANASFSNKKTYGTGTSKEEDNRDDGMEASISQSVLSVLQGLKKGMEIDMKSLWIKEGETSPPKRYNSGSMILAMENAGQLIEDEDLRSQIKGSGIGTSATRAEILSKLVKIKYLKLNKKTQLITPELLGEMVYDVVNISIRSLLNPELTASWELGLTQVADGIITSDEYMEKLNGFVIRRVDGVKQTNYQSMLRQMFDQAAAYYS
jgi:DNA topoisomerase-3